jgi:hypothetical protein
VYKATSAADLKERVTGILAEVKESWDLQWNPGLADVAPVMVEQFMVGDEFDVDLLFWCVSLYSCVVAPRCTVCGHI